MIAALLFALVAGPADPPAALDLPMSGEVTATSAVVQTRVFGARGGQSGAFLLSTSPDLTSPRRGDWRYPVGPREQTQPLRPDTHNVTDDGIARQQFDGLTPNTRYYYAWRPDPNERGPGPGRTGTFRTLPSADAAAPIEFVVVTGLNYAKFHGSSAIDRKQHLEQNDTELPPPAPEAERKLGYPMLEAIKDLDPHFAVFTGDTVYYDTPTEGRAETWEQMRAKWHAQFDQPRFRDLLAAVPIFHMKDDHDFRVDDSDNSGDYAPSPELGIAVFREQVPVVPHGDDETPTYRTVRCGKDLQLWFVEGRDYRSPNAAPDGPGKTIWGEEQYRWLTRTLRESDAAFKVLISPTPLVGPDDARKTDNHTNFGGFRHERGRFFEFLKSEGLLESGEFLVLCGDRHWQYHATHPTGVEEFSSGAIHRSNSRPGREAGDPQSTDPDGDIVQHYLMGRDVEPLGGFLHVRAHRPGGAPTLTLSHHVSVEGGPATRVAYSTDHTLTKDAK